MNYAGLLLPAVLAACRPAADEPFPSRPMTFVVPWNPGGGTDTGSRALAAVQQHERSQPVSVVNRTGGGGVVGHLALARAPADGHTIGAITVEITMMHRVGLTDLTPEDYTPIARPRINPGAVTVRRRPVANA